MKNERELFEEQPDIKAILQSGFQFNEDLNQYYHLDHTNHRLNYAFLMGAWFGWQASASREGYKLVPVEPCEKTLNEIKEKHWDMRGVQLCRSDYNDLYKAMIGAADEIN